MGRAGFLSYLRFKTRGNDFHRSSHRILDKSRFFGGVVDAVERISLERERGETNKTQAHPSFANNRSDRHGLKYLSLHKKKAGKRGGNSRD